MAHITSFAGATLTWQNFYLLVGTAAATLVGLMFVALTFGSSLVTEQTSPTARSFLDPTFNHFVLVLLVACLLMIPTMSPTLLGVLLVLIGAYRMTGLLRVYRHMRAAQRTHNDLELSDWVTGIALPLVCYLSLGLTGGAFAERCAVAFDALAAVTIALLLLGVFGAWELLVWMAIARARAK